LTEADHYLNFHFYREGPLAPEEGQRPYYSGESKSEAEEAYLMEGKKFRCRGRKSGDVMNIYS
jgi:hypothetical protein